MLGFCDVQSLLNKEQEDVFEETNAILNDVIPLTSMFKDFETFVNNYHVCKSSRSVIDGGGRGLNAYLWIPCN